MRVVTKSALCDLAVGEVLAGELGDPALAGCQRVEPGEHDPARARAGGAELGLGLFGERLGARAVGGVERSREKLALSRASIAPPKQGAEVSEGTRASNIASPRSKASMASRAEALHAHRRPRRRLRASPRPARAGRRMPGELELRRSASRAPHSRSPSARWASAACDRQEVARAGDQRLRQVLRRRPRKSSSPSATRPCSTRSRPRASRRTAAVSDPLSALGVERCERSASAASSSPAIDERLERARRR